MQQSSWKIAALTGIGGFILLITLIGVRRHDDSSPVENSLDTASSPAKVARPERAVTQAEALQTAAETVAQKSVAHQLAQLPRSTRGTSIDGRLQVDTDGNLVIDRQVRTFFDYMLTGIGEQPVASLVAEMRAMIDSQLQEPARSQAQALLTRYLDYKTALFDVERQYDASGAGPLSDDRLASLEQRLQAVMALRRQSFDAITVDAFFAEEEAEDRFTLGRLQVEADPQLSPEERSARLSQLEQNLPESVRERRQAALSPATSANQEKMLRQQGATTAQIQAWREQQYGAETADRLAKMDREQADWQRRYDRYQAERRQVLEAGLSETDRKRQIQQLRQRYFSAVEQRRVEALDRLSDG